MPGAPAWSAFPLGKAAHDVSSLVAGGFSGSRVRLSVHLLGMSHGARDVIDVARQGRESPGQGVVVHCGGSVVGPCGVGGGDDGEGWRR